MEIVWLIVGLLAGAAAGYFIAAAHAKARLAQELSQAASRASAAESLLAELRSQADKAAAERQTLTNQLAAEREARTAAQTQLEQAQKSAQEQKALLEETKARMLDAFKALSGDALRSNNQAFLELARERLEAVLAQAKGDIGQRQQAIDAAVKPLSAALEKYEEHLRLMDSQRVQSATSLEEQIKHLATSNQQLQKETGNLVTALRNPAVRGRWGEVTLHRVVELAGMSEHCDYSEQVHLANEEGALRPDMVVHLPGGRDIVVDAKVSLEAYLRAIDADDEVQRQSCLDQHAQQLRAHMQKLSGKSYWDQFEHTPEFVVMFIPGESFFASALDIDRSLLEDGMERRVVLATPTTLIALLRAVAYGWRQEKMAQNAQEICDLAKELYDRVKVFRSHLVKVGTALNGSVRAFNDSVGSLESRVLPSVRKFQELGAAGGEVIEPVEPLELTPRKLIDGAPPGDEA
jgi:DNA recombination protein RmuC